MRNLKQDLAHRKQKGLYRQQRLLQSPQGVETRIDGRDVISFCSNDYLGLANHPEVKQAFIEAAQQYGVGSGSAHLVNGHSQLHHECEQALAEFTGRERALLFSTGYMANLAVTSALTDRHDAIFQDKLNHASLIDAAKLSDARFKRYSNNDLSQLRHLIEATPARQRLVMADAVFSMDGDLADVPGLVKLAEQTDSDLMLDDAHGFGVLGKKGGGVCDALELSQQQVPILMATLGKAVGVSGAFIAGSDDLIETLIQQARSYIFTTASPPANASAIMQSLKFIQQEAWRREKLFELIDYFKQQMQSLEVELMPSETAIQPVVVGENHRALEISEKLFEQGIHVVAIRPPTVPAGTARLRITLSANHEKSHIDRLCSALSKV